MQGEPSVAGKGMSVMGERGEESWRRDWGLIVKHAVVTHVHWHWNERAVLGFVNGVAVAVPEVRFREGIDGADSRALLVAREDHTSGDPRYIRLVMPELLMERVLESVLVVAEMRRSKRIASIKG